MSASRGALYRDLVRRLRENAVASPELDARLLLSVATGISDVSLIADPDVSVDAEACARLETLVRRRLEGEPVSRILGTREFWGLEFLLGSETLDPRPDSETLIEAVLEAVDDRQAALRVLDLGTGSGCLLLALLSELPNATGLGIDCAEGALAVARQNAEHLGLAGRVQFQQGDWGKGLEPGFDLVVSNPPYIPTPDLDGLGREVRDHDPLRALDGGADGLDAYRVLAPCTERLLVPGGLAFWEFGIGQADDVSQIAEEASLTVAGTARDLGGLARVLIMKRPV
ncbi:MAG: peptide chain release factor N(5)-glutamine methyltransferase [Parvibaculaceae bacterium]